MTRDEARAILEAHNKWRRGGYVATESPSELGRAIDVAVEELAKPAPPSDSGARRGCQHCIPPGMYQDVEGRRPAVVGDRVALVVPDDPLAKPAVVPDVDSLANFIREVDGSNNMGAGRIAEHICEWLAASPQAPEVGQNRDAHEGCREDLLDWKRRALEAEATVLKFMIGLNGPTLMGKPAVSPVDIQAVREVIAHLRDFADHDSADQLARAIGDEK